jgi:hypothetical protein
MVHLALLSARIVVARMFVVVSVEAPVRVALRIAKPSLGRASSPSSKVVSFSQP